jgi:predicted acetyltransferase
MQIRPYEPSDLPAVQRIWKECGWIESDEEAGALEHLFQDAAGVVATMDEAAECSGTSHTGVIDFDGNDLPLAGVTSITTSRLGRKQGFAKAVTARLLSDAAENGAAVALLGIFEEGFYDQLGFGTGPYTIHYRFDPASLTVPYPMRTPVRLGPDDWQEIAHCLGSRKRSHGGVALDSATTYRAELAWVSSGFGLGFRSDEGELTHFVYCMAKGEDGPYRVEAMAYRDTAGLLELLGVLKSLGDQVRAVLLMEPPELQLQDVIRHPNRQRIVTRGTDFAAGGSAHAWWQLRILDLEACVGARVWAGPAVRFNLELDDPISRMDESWGGLSGSYLVEISDTSKVTPGIDPTAPTLRASVAAFSRMWIGARTASSLAVTGGLDGPPKLLGELDGAFRLPTPRTGLYL